MENREKQKNGEGVIVELSTKGKRTDTSADFILPDYMGDIKRMISYNAEVMPAGQFVSNEEISFSGIVTYRVIYLDGDNKLCEAGFTSDFEVDEPIDEAFLGGRINTDIATLSVRVGGPRKLIARAVLCSDIYILKNAGFPQIPNMEGLVVKRKSHTVHTAKYLEPVEVECAEEGKFIPGVSAEEIEEISTFGKIYITSTEKQDTGIRVNGEIAAKSILLIGGDSYTVVEKIIPVSARLSGDISPEADITAGGTLTALTVGLTNSVSQETSEAGASLVFNGICELYARCDGTEEVSLISDAYICDGTGELEFGEVYYNRYEGSFSASETFELSKNLGEVCGEEIAEILKTDVKIMISGTEFKEGRLNVSLELCFDSVARGAYDSGYMTLKSSFPVEMSLECGGDEGTDFDVAAFCGEAFIKTDGDRIYFITNAGLNVLAKSKVHTPVLLRADISENKPTPEAVPTITVYYPDGDDTLWQVAKKYKVQPELLAENNSLNIEAALTDSYDVPLGDLRAIFVKNP